MLTFAQVFGVRARAGVGAVAVMALSMALMVGVVAPANAGAPQAETAKLREPSVIIVGVPGLRWTDVDAQRTPYLWELSEVSALGQMSTRSARSRTCPADGWVQLGTGNRARYPMPVEPVEDGCPPLPEVEVEDDGGARVERWSAVVAENESLTFDAVPGLLGQTLRENAECALATGPGSALGAADESGYVTKWIDDPISLTPSSLRDCALSVVGVAPLSAERRLGEMSGLDGTDRVDRRHASAELTADGGGGLRPS